jgi:hypothetical protein
MTYVKFFRVYRTLFHLVVSFYHVQYNILVLCSLQEVNSPGSSRRRRSAQNRQKGFSVACWVTYLTSSDKTVVGVFLQPYIAPLTLDYTIPISPGVSKKLHGQ